MVRHGPLWMLVLIGAGISLLGGSRLMAGAAEKETRVFKIKIDGKIAGEYQMEISSPDERTFVVKGLADVATSYYLFIKFHYHYEGTEVWKDGRLVQLTSHTDDDGKLYRLSAQADQDGLVVKVNDQERKIRPDVWTTTYWHLPDARFRTQVMTLLDCDTGKEQRGAMSFVGTQQLVLTGQRHNCAHYRIRGTGVQVDAWYDSQERLVREQYIEDKHQIALELVRIGH